MKIPCVFTRDTAKLLQPELTPGAEWVLSDPTAIMSIMLDGVAVEVTFEQITGIAWGWKLHVTDTPLRSGFTLDREIAEDKPFFAGFDSMRYKSAGMHVAYGMGIKGNPHGFTDSLMVKVNPLDSTLLVSRYSSIVKRAPRTSVQDFFDSLKAELTASPEIPGLVFHLEDPVKHVTTKMAKVRREDFGLASIQQLRAAAAQPMQVTH